MVRSAHIAILLGVFLMTPAFARADGSAVAPDDEILPASPMYQANGVTVDEHVGAHVPLDAQFRTQDGKLVSLGQVLAGDLPTILTFNYSDCPMLCSIQLNGLSTALPKIAVPAPTPGSTEAVELRLGKQFRIISIDLEPTEALDKAKKMRERYLTRMPIEQQATAREGWTFLVAATPGDAAAIRRVADAVGFKYTYIPERAEWAHPAALIFLGTSGVVTRYVYGIEFETSMMRESIYKAGLSEPATAVGFMNRCYHYDPDANSHAHAGVVALKIGAAGFVMLVLSGLGVMHLVKRTRAPALPSATGNRPGVDRS
jgi:protein SCO1/2